MSDWIPVGVAAVSIAAVWFAIRAVFSRQGDRGVDVRYRRQGVDIILAHVALIVAVILAPMDGDLRGQILSLIGLLISAVLALSSTSVMGNLIAGVMLRVVSSFRAGDFIAFRDTFGRVAQRGLLHVEVQNEEGELVTVPNLLLVREPYRVLRGSGAVISAEVSLGYDIHHRDAEAALAAALEAAELADGFVQIRDLGDFSVTYRTSGKLADVGAVVSARSRLRARMIDALHDAGIEIVSPTFNNKRDVAADAKVMPERRAHGAPDADEKAERVLFDKADAHATVAQLEEALRALDAGRSESDADGEDARARQARDRERAELAAELEVARRRAEAVDADDRGGAVGDDRAGGTADGGGTDDDTGDGAHADDGDAPRPPKRP